MFGPTAHVKVLDAFRKHLDHECTIDQLLDELESILVPASAEIRLDLDTVRKSGDIIKAAYDKLLEVASTLRASSEEDRKKLEYRNLELVAITLELGTAKNTIEQLQTSLQKKVEDNERDKKKWQDYEENYILPVYTWATELGIDLPTLIRQNPGNNCVKLFFWELRLRLTENVAVSTVGAPIPMIIHCPACRQRHIDRGLFATKPHHTHACQGCGFVWRPAVVPTLGVEFLPGFRDDDKASSFEG